MIILLPTRIKAAELDTPESSENSDILRHCPLLLFLVSPPSGTGFRDTPKIQSCTPALAKPPHHQAKPDMPPCAMDWQCPPRPSSSVEAWSPHVMCGITNHKSPFGGETLGKWLGLAGRAPRKGWVPWEGDEETRAHAPHQRRTQHETAIRKPGRGFTPEPTHPGSLTLASQPPEQWGTDVCSLSLPVYGIFVVAAWID